MGKMRFIIVGSGWRSLYYVRIAKALPEQFEMCAMLCRSQEKADKMSSENGIYATTSIEECKNLKPDFVVVVVNKASIAQVSKEWLNYGFTVLCETPASLELDVLQELWELHNTGKRLVVAEQYTHYPTYKAMLSVLGHNLIGEPDCINISLAHEYHGTSLMRAFLRENVATPFTVKAKTYEFETVETLTRYEKFKDGRTALKKRTTATFEFANGKVAWYDFDSEQYRSPIRKNFVKLQGRKGELIDNKIYFLDDIFEPQQGEFIVTENFADTSNTNPNFKKVREIEKITFRRTDMPDSLVYAAPFGKCGLSEDETAIAQLMQAAAEYTWACEILDKSGSQSAVDIKEDEPKTIIKTDLQTAVSAVKEGNARLDDIINSGFAANINFTADVVKAIAIKAKKEVELKNALQDSYMTILMQKAVETGETISSEKQIWQD